MIMTDHDSIPDRDMTYSAALAWLLSRGQSEFGAAMTLLTAWKEHRAVIGDGTIQITCTPDRIFRAAALNAPTPETSETP